MALEIGIETIMVSFEDFWWCGCRDVGGSFHYGHPAAASSAVEVRAKVELRKSKIDVRDAQAGVDGGGAAALFFGGL